MASGFSGYFGNALGGLFSGAQQAQVDSALAQQQAAMMKQPYGISASTDTATVQYHYSADTNLFTLGPKPNRTRTAVEWLEDRVNEMRVKL